MKKFSLNSTPGGDKVTPYFKDKTAFDDYYIIDDYLIIRELTSTLTIFKINKNNSADFLKEIVLKNQNQIKSMQAINPQNLFLIFHNMEIIVIDIEKATQTNVLISETQKKQNLSCSLISIHDQCKLMNSKTNVYIGFIIIDSTELYLTYKTDSTKQYTLNCFYIKSFKQEVIHVEYKFFEANGTFLFICILCKFEGYVSLVQVDQSKDIKVLSNSLRDDTKWLKIYTDNSLKFYHSFYFHPTIYENNSFMVLNESNKCTFWSFNHELKLKTFLTKSELVLKCDNSNIININHYSNYLYIITKKDILEFKISSSQTEPTSTTPIKNVMGIIKTSIEYLQGLYFLFCITTKDLFLMAIKGHFHQPSNQSISLSGIDLSQQGEGNPINPIPISGLGGLNTLKNSLKISTSKGTSVNPTTNQNKDNNANFSLAFDGGNSTLRGSSSRKNDSNSKAPKENSNLRATTNSNPEPTIVCSKCDKLAKYRCNMCKKFFVCSPEEHEQDWKEHEKSCPVFLRKNKIEIYNNLIPYKSEWDAERKEIIELLKQKNYAAAIEKNYILIQTNFQRLSEYEKEGKILPFRDINTVKSNSDRILSSYLYYEDYFCNILLLIYAFSIFKSKDEVWRLLNRLIKLMEAYNFTGVTDIVVTTTLKKIRDSDSCDKLEVEQEIYLRILKLLITIARYGHSLGEFTFYEKYLLDYVQKIQLVYSSDAYIMNNTYLLLGNLYIGFNLLKKGHILYDFIIDTNNLSNKDNQSLYEVVLCANYNSGLINFVIDKYDIAKQRLETALKIKRELLKEKNDLQISIIYEALAEIDIEYKNYSSAFVYLQKAIEARELSNTNDKEFKLKAQELREYIDQNSTDTKANMNSNLQLRRGKTTEEIENEKLILNMLNDCQVNVDRNPDVTELEKFFLFMTKLSYDKIQKLNEDQPEDYEKNKFFPIVFSKNFKNSLTHNQRLALCDLKLTSLTRINVLKNYMKKITIKNLNYNALNLVPPENNINSIRNLYVTKSILKNWEIKEDDEEEDDNESEDKKSDGFQEKKEDESFNKEELSEKSESHLQKTPERTRPVIKKEKTMKEKKKTLPKEDEEEIDYVALKNSIRQYCRRKCPEKEKFIDDKFLFLLCRESDMTKDEIKKIIENPEIIGFLIDTYAEICNENMTEPKNDDKDPFDDFVAGKEKEPAVTGFIPPPPKFDFPKIV